MNPKFGLRGFYMDSFAQIAKSGIQGKKHLLQTPQPIISDYPPITLSDCRYAPHAVPHKMNTAQELYAELAKLRDTYAPFLQNHAPLLPTLRQTITLKDFLWQKEGASEWKNVSLPHYGEPLGAATTFYKTTFSLENIPEGKRVFVTIHGADYKAYIYVNHRFVGMHEGFFATFEFDVTNYVTAGENELKIELHNDYVMLGNFTKENPQTLFGDKIYAATGPGYDDPQTGWHHCPPGMGLLEPVEIQIRSAQYINSVFSRTLDEEIEFWVEVGSSVYEYQTVSLDASVYGQNIEQTVLEHLTITPTTGKEIGMGDTFTEVIAKREGTLNAELPLPCGKGRNLYKFRIAADGLKFWSPETPWLYQIQLKLLNKEGTVIDTFTQQFARRTFTQDTQSTPKGKFYLNGEEIRLFGANTMGFEQQDVMNDNEQQLIDDILLAKICNMNFWRITQRPVQQKIYDFCDKLGLMVQTDLPLFGYLRRHQFCEAVRQAEEMERHIRSHACCILVSYINEPFPNAGNLPSMNLERFEMEQFFAAADIVVKLNNPDRVIKYVDGDYDPPSDSMPDNHCYPMWYNGHGIDIGRLHKGYWMPVRPDWHYGCGEFGCEGLEDWSLMQECYPKSWLLQEGEKPSDWDPKRIVRAQTADFYHFFYNRPSSPEEWVQKSQQFQALATHMMTEAFRRDNRMVSFAIHLFIDAFPSGWMKTIMDCKRTPKPAFFEYQRALQPLMLSLRADKTHFFGAETAFVEGWVCNSTKQAGNFRLAYELIDGDTVIRSSQQDLSVKANLSACYSNACFTLPEVSQRTVLKLRALLLDATDNCVAWNELEYVVFPQCALPANIQVTDIQSITEQHLDAVRRGGILWVNTPAAGVYLLDGTTVEVKESGMSPMHFAASDTEHPWLEGLLESDFRHWYDSETDCIAPLAECTVIASGYRPVLQSRNIANGVWQTEALVCEKQYGAGRIVISEIPYQRMLENPAGKIILSKIQ